MDNLLQRQMKDVEQLIKRQQQLVGIQTKTIYEHRDDGAFEEMEPQDNQGSGSDLKDEQDVSKHIVQRFCLKYDRVILVRFVSKFLLVTE